MGETSLWHVYSMVVRQANLSNISLSEGLHGLRSLGQMAPQIWRMESKKRKRNYSLLLLPSLSPPPYPTLLPTLCFLLEFNRLNHTRSFFYLAMLKSLLLLPRPFIYSIPSTLGRDLMDVTGVFLINNN